MLYKDFMQIIFQVIKKIKLILATCSGGEDINRITENPVDPVTFGPFCRECHVIIANPWRQKMGDIHYLEENMLETSELPITQKYLN